MGRHDDEHLRRFLAARARGDAAEMRRWWDELVIDFVDRMDGFVAAQHKGRLDDDEHELAVQLAMIRFSQNLISTFEGVSMGQLVKACRTLAFGICVDVQRSAVRERGPSGTHSLDDGWDADGEDGPAPAWEAEEAARLFEREQRSAEVLDFLAWALPQLGRERRDVIELTFQGAEVGEIMRELGISQANVYARRSRGMKDLKQLKEQYDA